jgi:hypothetical protein
MATKTPIGTAMANASLAHAQARSIRPPLRNEKLKRQNGKDTVRDVWGGGSGQYIVR